jgi:hypothetical protein
MVRPGGGAITAATLGDYAVNRIEAGTGRNGSRGLYCEITQRGDDAAQDPFQLLGSDQAQLYISSWIKLQPDLTQNLHDGNAWRPVFEFKTAGDFRMSVNITAYGGTTPRWDLRLDNVANGGHPQEEYHRGYSTLPVPEGTWFKLEVFWHRGGGSDGRAWAAVDGQVIDDYHGNMIGVDGAPIDRIFVTQTYSGGATPYYQWVDDVQIWSTFPTAAPGDAWYDPPYASH